MTERICAYGRDHGYSCCPEHSTHKMRSLGGHTRGCPDRVDATTRDTLIEAGASALVGGTTYVMSGDAGAAGTMNRLTATFVLDAILPLVTEELAKVLDSMRVSHQDCPNPECAQSYADAARIVRAWVPS